MTSSKKQDHRFEEPHVAPAAAKPGATNGAVEAPDEPDRVLTPRIAPQLYEAIVLEAKAARHSINSAATILLEQALEARGKWKYVKQPFWARVQKQK